MPTIENCFNCLRTRSSDAKKLKDDNQNPKIQNLRQSSLYPPPPGRGKGGLTKMGHVPEGRVSEPACFGTAPAPAPGKREQKFGFF